MNINKKFRIFNITFISLTCVFFLLTILGIISTVIEKKKEPVEYIETSEIDYLINDKYTKKDNISFASNEVNSIVVTIEYYNNKNKNLTLDATKTTLIKTKDFSGKTVYGAFGEIEYVEEDLAVDEYKTTITYVVDYQAYQTTITNYISDPNNGIDSNKAAGRLDLKLFVTDDRGEVKEAVVTISLLEDVVGISINKTISNTSTFLDSNYKMALLVTLVCGVFFVVAFVCFAISYKLSTMDSYERKLFVIFKLNKGILVESNLDNLANEIEIKSFKELLKVQNSVSLPILYSKSNDGAKFVIKVSNSVYSYTITK